MRRGVIAYVGLMGLLVLLLIGLLLLFFALLHHNMPIPGGAPETRPMGGRTYGDP